MNGIAVEREFPSKLTTKQKCIMNYGAANEFLFRFKNRRKEFPERCIAMCVSTVRQYLPQLFVHHDAHSLCRLIAFTLFPYTILRTRVHAITSAQMTNGFAMPNTENGKRRRGDENRKKCLHTHSRVVRFCHAMCPSRSLVCSQHRECVCPA